MIGVGERVLIEQRERWSAIHQDEVVVADRTHPLFEQLVRIVPIDETHLGFGKNPRAGDGVETRAHVDNRVGRMHVFDEHMVERVARLETQRLGDVALGVEVDEQRAVSGIGEASGDVDAGGSLASAALLIEHGDALGCLAAPSHRVEARVATLHPAELSRLAIDGGTLEGILWHEGSAAGVAGRLMSGHHVLFVTSLTAEMEHAGVRALNLVGERRGERGAANAAGHLRCGHERLSPPDSWRQRCGLRAAASYARNSRPVKHHTRFHASIRGCVTPCDSRFRAVRGRRSDRKEGDADVSCTVGRRNSHAAMGRSILSG